MEEEKQGWRADPGARGNGGVYGFEGVYGFDRRACWAWQPSELPWSDRGRYGSGYWIVGQLPQGLELAVVGTVLPLIQLTRRICACTSSSRELWPTIGDGRPSRDRLFISLTNKYETEVTPRLKLASRSSSSLLRRRHLGGFGGLVPQHVIHR